MAVAGSMLPRKTAVQRRSRVTVETLLDATARVLTRDGYDRASTNRIAVVAGISIGSLYQYFPNKEALVAALLTRHNREMLALLREAMAAVTSLPLEPAVRTLVRAMLDAHRVDPELHRIFDEQIPRMGQLAEIAAIERETFALVRAYLEQHRDEIRAADLDLATFVCVTSVETLTHEIVVRGAGVPSADDEAVLDEITRLIVGYLAPT